MSIISDFSSSASIRIIPANIRISGFQEVSEFFLVNAATMAKIFPSLGAESQGAIGITVTSSEITSKFAVEEFTMKCRFDKDLEWMMPGIKPNYALITVDMVKYECCFMFLLICRFLVSNLI